jgi:hypothetical protein
LACFWKTYVATGEVTALKHEVGDDSVEGRTLVAEALLASAESTEVLSGLGDHVVEEVEVDATLLLCRGLASAHVVPSEVLWLGRSKGMLGIGDRAPLEVPFKGKGIVTEAFELPDEER